MTFSTDTDWPLYLRAMFNSCNDLPQDRVPYAAYPALLSYRFGESFIIMPHTPPRDAPPRSDINTLVFLTVIDMLQGGPVFFTEIKDDSWKSSAERRVEADRQFRQWFRSSLLKDCPVPRLRGISILGSSMRVYYGDVATGKITPPYREPPQVIPPGFLEGEWNINILSKEGHRKMRELLNDIATDLLATLDRSAKN
ncbi:hypothetical protein BDN70DRAFT_924540 [Pholiota conissans]|uniref:Uncharacterized protein n=1 Tax=Pholiota conissans TaxID=109636 RepID=A0A9P5YV96_9AGAR|nr:hypothetical protein BDN70DRAFT_924540 [Pholiota conissans]